jgi:hypothetical protein
MEVDEIHRVLSPGGGALVMVYYRGSLDYRFNILIVRRLLVLRREGAEGEIVTVTSHCTSLRDVFVRGPRPPAARGAHATRSAA